MEKEAVIPIPRTAKSSSSAELPSLLSGIAPPPPPSQPPVQKIQSRQGGPQSHQVPQQQRHFRPQQQYHQFDYHHNQQGVAKNGNQPPPNHIAQRPPSATDFARPFSSSSQLPQCFPPTMNVVSATNPRPPPPPLSDEQKKTLRHLDTLAEVISNKIADQIEIIKKKEINSTVPGGGIGSSREYKRQREHQGNVDVFGSFITNEDNRYDFFDTDPTTNTILVPQLPNRSIPIFPEDFPPGKKEWPLSWWGICEPSSGLLALHENMANDLGFPIKKRGVPSTKKKDTGRDSIDDFTLENEMLVGRKEKEYLQDDRSGRDSMRDDRLKNQDRDQSSEQDRRQSSERRKKERMSDSRRERTSSDSRNHESRRRKESDPLLTTERRKRERSNSDSRRSRDSSKHKRHNSGDRTERRDDRRRDDSGRSNRGDSSHRGDSRRREKSHRDKSDKEKDYTKRSTHKSDRRSEGRERSHRDDRDKSIHRAGGKDISRIEESTRVTNSKDTSHLDQSCPPKFSEMSVGDRGNGRRDESRRAEGEESTRREEINGPPDYVDNIRGDRIKHHPQGKERSHRGENDHRSDNRGHRDERGERNMFGEMVHPGDKYPDSRIGYRPDDRRERPSGERHRGDRWLESHHGERHPGERYVGGIYHGDRNAGRGDHRPYPGGGPFPDGPHIRIIDNRDREGRLRHESIRWDSRHGRGERGGHERSEDSRYRNDRHPEGIDGRGGYRGRGRH